MCFGVKFCYSVFSFFGSFFEVLWFCYEFLSFCFPFSVFSFVSTANGLNILLMPFFQSRADKHSNYEVKVVTRTQDCSFMTDNPDKSSRFLKDRCMAFGFLGIKFVKAAP